MFIPIRGANRSRRLGQLITGVVLFGVGVGLMLQSGLGLPPWDVLHQGLAVHFGLTVGIWSIIISFVVLALWMPLRQPYGPGTILNVVIIGVLIDVTAWLVPEPTATLARWVMLLGGVLVIGVASGMYIGANLGPGPRDGLMTGIARRGPSIRLTRTVIEVVVLGMGWALGGTFGWGTVVFALTVGPLVHYFLPRWTVDTGLDEDAWVHPAR